jgi:hypothetical protein
MPDMHTKNSDTQEQPDSRISWSIYLIAAGSLCLIGLLLESWGLFPDLPHGGLFWVALVVGGITGFIVNLVRPRYATGRWRAFYDFLLRQLPPPD